MVAPGESARLGKDSSVRAVTRGDTRRFATLHPACHRAAAFLEPRSRSYRSAAVLAGEGEKPTNAARNFRTAHSQFQTLRILAQRFEDMNLRHIGKMDEIVDCKRRFALDNGYDL